MTLLKAFPIPPPESGWSDGDALSVEELTTLLVMAAQRQRGLPTVVAMRRCDVDPGGAPADRIVRLMAAWDRPAGWAKGAFNRAIARHLSEMKEGEEDFYRGA
ncbi:MAG: hypothetical protein ABW184_01280 [Sphingobium sp.]